MYLHMCIYIYVLTCVSPQPLCVNIYIYTCIWICIYIVNDWLSFIKLYTGDMVSLIGSDCCDCQNQMELPIGIFCTLHAHQEEGYMQRVCMYLSTCLSLFLSLSIYIYIYKLIHLHLNTCIYEYIYTYILYT